MTVLKLKLAAVAAISLLSLSFEAAPAAAGGFSGKMVAVVPSSCSQRPSIHLAGAEPPAMGSATVATVVAMGRATTVAAMRRATTVAMVAAMRRATTVAMVVVSIVVAFIVVPPIEDIVAVSIGAASSSVGT